MNRKKITTFVITTALAFTVLPQKFRISRPKAQIKEVVINNPQIEKDDSMESGRKVTYSYIWFGCYPQSEVKESRLTSDITGAEYDENNEAVVNGVKYCRMQYTDATAYHSKNIPGAADTPDDYYYNWKDGGDEQGYHYFQYEPICWRVLSIEGDKALLLADKGLDTQPYNVTNEAVSWETSSVRSWLNGYEDKKLKKETRSFMEKAFDKKEQEAILPINVKSASGGSVSAVTGETPSDKAVLLSKDDLLNETYGYIDLSEVKDEARRCAVSTYAFAMGSYVYRGTNEEMQRFDGCCWWWLRDAGQEKSRAAGISRDGTISEYGRSVSYKNNSVRPAIYVDLTAEDVFMEKPVDSQEPEKTEEAGPKPSGEEPPQTSGDVKPQYVPGDLNGDGKVTLMDAQLALKAALNLTELDEAGKRAANVDGDEAITLFDAQIVLKAALNLAVL